MSREIAIIQGTLAGVLFGTAVVMSNASDTFYNKTLSNGDATTKYHMRDKIADVISLGLYGSAGGLAIAAIAGATRREEKWDERISPDSS